MSSARDLRDLFYARLRDGSGFDTHRPYIGLSKAGDCPRRIFNEFKTGLRATTDNDLQSWRGYTIEKALLDLLGSSVCPGREIIAFDGLVKGHTDGEFKGDLLEIKSSTDEKVSQINREGRVPRRHFMQVQAYMHFGGIPSCNIIYMPRDFGSPLFMPVPYVRLVGERLKEKFYILVSAVKSGNRPACECGRCGEVAREGGAK